jgi:hypothetical protein
MAAFCDSLMCLMTECRGTATCRVLVIIWLVVPGYNDDARCLVLARTSVTMIRCPLCVPLKGEFRCYPYVPKALLCVV